jgi:polysaccharide export outer membrane protein
MSDQNPEGLNAPFQNGSRARPRRPRAWALLPLLALAACSVRGGPIPYDVKDFGKPDQPVALDVAHDYRIAPDDVVAVDVFGVSEFSGTFTIDALGRLRLPLVGDFQAQGLTVDELSAQVAQKLGASYLRDPKVQVAVKEARGRKVTIEGSVQAPGVYPIGNDTTLLQMIAMAHGTTDDANLRRVAVFRTIDGQRMAAAFDVKDIQHGKMADPAIYQNDIIVVAGSKSRQAFRDVISAVPTIGVFAAVLP